MREAGQPEEAIRGFASAYERLESGESAMLPSAELEPAGDVTALDELPDADAADALGRVAVIKLNGGLATSMGLRSPKSLVEAREGRSFLDIIVGQTLALRRRYCVRLPLVLMNSAGDARRRRSRRSTRTPSSATGCRSTSCRAWCRSSTPRRSSRSAGRRDPSLEWYPPGHGDVYGALRSSGMLDALLEQRLPLRDDLQRRQSRRDRRRADRRRTSSARRSRS